MAKHNTFRKRFDFSKIPATIQIPNLIEVQKRSYERFLQMDKLPSEREDGGLQAVFQSVFPITDFRNVSQLEFVDYAIGNWECKCGHLKGLHHLRTTCKNCGSTVITDPFHPGDVLCHKCGTYNANTPDFCNKCGDPVGLQLKYDVAECEERGMTYSAPLKVTMRLTIWDKDPETGNRSIRDIKEQEVFFGDVPLMTQNGTFIINGTERVIVSQLHRSPGVFFETANNRTYFLGKIIPYRGSWVEFEYDQKNVLYVRIDRKRKFLGTIFLRALGLRAGEDILRTFYTVDRLAVRDNKLFWTLDPASDKATNLVGMEKKCPTGKLNGPYEHFDIVEIKQSAPGEAPELVGKRIHRRSNLLTRTAPDRPEIDEGRDVGLEDFRLEVGVGELLDVRAGHSNLRYCCLCNLAAGPRQPHRLAGHA